MFKVLVLGTVVTSLICYLVFQMQNEIPDKKKFGYSYSGTRELVELDPIEENKHSPDDDEPFFRIVISSKANSTSSTQSQSSNKSVLYKSQMQENPTNENKLQPEVVTSSLGLHSEFIGFENSTVYQKMETSDNLTISTTEYMKVDTDFINSQEILGTNSSTTLEIHKKSPFFNPVLEPPSKTVSTDVVTETFTTTTSQIKNSIISRPQNTYLPPTKSFLEINKNIIENVTESTKLYLPPGY